MSRLLAVACLFAVLPACTWRLGYGDENCGPDDNCGLGGSGGAGSPCQDDCECEPPLTCSASLCTCPGGTTEVCGDGVDNNCDGQVNEACGRCDTLSTLTDAFDDGLLGAVWELSFASGGASVTETGGHTVISLGSTNGN